MFVSSIQLIIAIILIIMHSSSLVCRLNKWRCPRRSCSALQLQKPTWCFETGAAIEGSVHDASTTKVGFIHNKRQVVLCATTSHYFGLVWNVLSSFSLEFFLTIVYTARFASFSLRVRLHQQADLLSFFCFNIVDANAKTDFHGGFLLAK